MVARLLHKLFGGQRKYLVRRHELGDSARQRAFDAFDQGLRPAQAAREVDISLRTACRYFYDWKRQSNKIAAKYDLAKDLLRRPDLREEIASILATESGMSVDQVLARLQKPWAVRQVVTGRWRKWKAEKGQDLGISRPLPRMIEKKAAPTGRPR